MAAEAGPEQAVPARDDRGKERMQRFAPDPGLDPEPPAGDERTHQRGQIRAERPVSRPGEDRERDAVLRAGMRVQEDRDQDDRISEQDGGERLLPVHPGRHETGREHVGRDAVRHADPERGVVVRRPVAPRDGHGREIVIEERAAANTA